MLWSFCIPAFAILFASASAQNNSTQSLAGSCSLNSTAIDNAVAFGMSAHNMSKGSPSSMSGNGEFRWLYTVDADGEWNMSLAAYPETNPYNISSWYTLCGINIDITRLAIERGQNDEGQCNQALSPECVAALSDAGSNGALNYSQAHTKPFYSSEASCNASRDAVAQAAFSNASCSPFFDRLGPPSVSSWLFNDPYQNTTTCNGTLQKLLPGWGVSGTRMINNQPLRDIFNESDPHAAYDEAFRDVKAVMAVYMPNFPASEGIAGAWVYAAPLSCVRVTNTTDDATRTPSPLPDPAPVTSSPAATSSSAAGGSSTRLVYDATYTVYGSAVVVAILASFIFGSQLLW